MTHEHMLIDGRNAVYRAVYAGMSNDSMTDDFTVILFRFLNSYMNKFKPNNVHFFWDCPKEEIWRKRIYKEYKDHRDTSHAGRYDKKVVDDAVTRCVDLAQKFTSHMCCRNYIREKQEADDLIYAFCKQCRDTKIIIVSSDNDFKQIPFYFENVSLFNPLGKTQRLYERENIDPSDLKALTGEDGDNITGYNQIGPVRATAILSDFKKRAKFFEENGSELYLRNRALIDMSLNPYMLSNLMYILEVLSKDISFDPLGIRDIIQKYKVKGLQGEYNKTILPYKRLGK